MTLLYTVYRQGTLLSFLLTDAGLANWHIILFLSLQWFKQGENTPEMPGKRENTEKPPLYREHPKEESVSCLCFGYGTAVVTSVTQGVHVTLILCMTPRWPRTPCAASGPWWLRGHGASVEGRIGTVISLPFSSSPLPHLFLLACGDENLGEHEALVHLRHAPGLHAGR